VPCSLQVRDRELVVKIDWFPMALKVHRAVRVGVEDMYQAPFTQVVLEWLIGQRVDVWT